MQKRNFFKTIATRLLYLAKLPVFWVVTIVGNTFVFGGAVALYLIEGDIHSKPVSLLDCLSWSVGLVTTIGYSDLIPISTAGKILGIAMMVGGTLFLWSYMALIVTALFTPDISMIEREIQGIKKETDLDNKKINELILKIDLLSKKIEKPNEPSS